jgi:hypothetical protein
MIDRANLQTADAPLGSSLGQVLDQAKRLWAKLADVLTVNAKVRGAVIVYEELSRLSDAEHRVPRHTPLRSSPVRLRDLVQVMNRNGRRMMVA